MKTSKHNSSRLRKLLAKFGGKKVLVVGDLIIDEYLFGDAKRISPEAPIPVFELKQESATPGAAAYVASHIQHLGGVPFLCGITGSDANGDRIRSLLEEQKIATDGLYFDPTRPTIVKTRVIARHQQMLRIDRESVHPISAAQTGRILDFMRKTLPEMDAVVFSDYDKGTFTPSLIDAAIKMILRAKLPLAVNPKPHLAPLFRRATFVSMNQSEASATLHRPLEDEGLLKRGGVELRRKLGVEGLLVTRAERGMALFQANSSTFIPALAKEVFDGTGAGDTVVSLVAMGLAAGGALVDSVRLSNVAAAIEVGKLGCALVSREEIGRIL